MQYVLYCFSMLIFSINAMEGNHNYFLFDKSNCLLREKILSFNSSGIKIMGFMIKKKHYDLVAFLNKHASIINTDLVDRGKEELKYFFEENIHRTTLKKYKLEEDREHSIAMISLLREYYTNDSLFGLFDENYALDIIQEYLNPTFSIKVNVPLVYLLLPHYFKSNFIQDKESFKAMSINKLRILYQKLGYEIIFVDLSNSFDVPNSADPFFSFLQSDLEFKGTIFCINNNVLDNEKFKINFPKLHIDSIFVEKLYLKNEKKLLLLYTPCIKSFLLDKYKNILNNIEFFEKQIVRQEKHKGLKKTCMKMLNELVLQLFIQ